jgi:hypothetical protein
MTQNAGKVKSFFHVVEIIGFLTILTVVTFLFLPAPNHADLKIVQPRASSREIRAFSNTTADTNHPPSPKCQKLTHLE